MYGEIYVGVRRDRSSRRNSIHNKRKIALSDAIILATPQARRLLVGDTQQKRL
jgi:hypothetical protein